MFNEFLQDHHMSVSVLKNLHSEEGPDDRSSGSTLVQKISLASRSEKAAFIYFHCNISGLRLRRLNALS